MQHIKYLVWLSLAVAVAAQSSEKCSESAEEVEECTDTEYHSYVECMRRRTKRSLDCNRSCDDCGGGGNSDACSECDCSYCSYNDCSSNCNSCCQQTAPPCQTRSCCHQTCNSQCRTISCRRRCRSRCHTKMSSGGGGSSSSSMNTATNANVSSGVRTEAKHNITTVINLHNVINNTNIIDMPITLNNTNINNITVEAAEGGSTSTKLVVEEHEEESVDGEEAAEETTEKENCCRIVGPRQCMQIKTFPFVKCFHYRKHHCGELCKTGIMHAEPHEVCDQTGTGSPTCHQQIAYIPQPQPRCTYTSQWPYVSCNIIPQNCGGCYKHLVQGGSPPAGCHQSCYDQGFNVGPMYRPGPFYQANYPMSNCGMAGNCESAAFGALGQQQAAFPQIGGMGQGYYGYENPMENMMQIEPSPEAVQYNDIHQG